MSWSKKSKGYLAVLGLVVTGLLVSMGFAQPKAKLIAEETSYTVELKSAAEKKSSGKPVAIAEETTWSPNFKDESVEVIAAKLGKQFDKKVNVSPTIKGKKISLSLSKATFDETVKAITLPQGWEYIDDGKTITLLTRDEYQTEMKQRITTKIFAIKYRPAVNIAEGIQPIVSNWGSFRVDKLNNQLIVTDTPNVLAEIEKVIANLDIPYETKIIPIRYSNIENLMEVLEKKRTLFGNITRDKKNNLIITDTPQTIKRMEDIIAQFEENARSIPQVNIDCNIIKVALTQKYTAGIDWTTCPFLTRELSAKTGVYLKNVDLNKLLDWLKIFGEAELISRKKTTVVPGNQVSVREGAQYQVIINYPAVDTTKPVMSTRNTFDSGFTYTFLVQSGIDEKEKTIQLNYKVDGVLPESGNRITYSINVDNARIKEGYTLVTEDIRRLPLGSISGIVLDDSQNLKYGSIDLILLITPSILLP
ncbi:MAG: hypothetical protein N3A72_10565 [bacterium]|nr:hypothetical protein [bacterium]